MERLINRRQQGDLGEASAIEWLTRLGANLFLPLGHSPDVDLIAEVDGHPLRIQVKTSVYSPDDRSRWSVSIRTNGGNQSWTGTSKLFDPSKVDYLFVLVGDGRRWFIPSAAVEASTSLNLGGTKYSEYEIDPAKPILQLVFDGQRDLSTIENPAPGEYPSGQRGRAVNALVNPSQVRILPPPSEAPEGIKTPRSQQATIWGKRRLTVPEEACSAADLTVGDRARVQAAGSGRLIIERIEDSPNLSAVEQDRKAG